MTEFDELLFENFTVPELIAEVRNDNRIMWGSCLCVTGCLQVFDHAAFLSDETQTSDLLAFQGPTLKQALADTEKNWTLFGGIMSFEGPASVWFRGLHHSTVPHVGAMCGEPIRLRFACRTTDDQTPVEPIDIFLPRRTKCLSQFELLGQGLVGSLVRLADQYSTNLLLHRPDLLANLYEDIDKISTLSRKLWSLDKSSPIFQDLSSWSGNARQMLQQILRDYERFMKEHELPLPYSPTIGDRQCPMKER